MSLAMIRTAVVVIAVGAICTGSMTMAGSPGEHVWGMEVAVGRTLPGPDNVVDDGNTISLRGGYMLNERIGLSGSLGYTSFGDDLDSSWEGSLDIDAVNLDFDIGYVFLPEKRFSITPFGGVGYASFNVDGTVVHRDTRVAIRFDDYDTSSFTLNAGMGTVTSLTPRTFLRIRSLWRWYEDRDDDEVDQELTIAYGWTFGR